MPPESDSIARRCSPFLDGLIRSRPQWWDELETSGRLRAAQGPTEERLAALVEEAGLDPGLRQFRNQEMMRIVWRDLDRHASIEDTMEDLTRLAEICLQGAIQAHTRRLTERYGTPRGADGSRQKLVVIGMGKLGGRELNLSSDIDLMFCFPQAGDCDGARGLANEQFFLRLTRAVIHSLSEISEHGFCFRVDTRLRPFGESGPLVCSFGAMEQYYQREGRDWERYALIKARPVAGDLSAGNDLLQLLKPFIYRRYIDYGAIEALQEMHAAVRKDAADRGREQDIKRGGGGIREIEFMVQAYQLLRGGREPALQTPSLFAALAALVELRLMDGATAEVLQDNYRFLRKLENAVQALHDQQTHDLPQGDDLERVAAIMRCSGTEQLLAEVTGVRKAVNGLFLEHLQPQEDPVDSRWETRWRALQENASAGEHGIELQRFIARLARQSLSQRASSRLDQFMPRLLQRLQRRPMAPQALGDILELVLAITRRSAYLSLLVQNPAALDRMLVLFEESDWIAATVIRHPALLDELIDPRLGQLLPDPGELQTMAQRIQRSHENSEDVLQALNHMKLAVSLRIAVAELETTLTARQVQRTLTSLAEVLLSASLALAIDETRGPSPANPGHGLCVIGYGSLGAQELSYTSDLDLIFLYDADSDDGLEREHTRVARKLISLLTIPTASGKLYATDTRLRPNGRSGLLVSTISAFERYQREKAWTWELQALTRARALSGNEDVAKRFGRARRDVLTRSRSRAEVRRQIIRMRQRMRAEFSDGDPFKHGPGGLVDIDFIAQLGVLESAPRHPGLLTETSTARQLELLAEAGWLPRSAAETLRATHEALSRARHLSFLARTGPEGSLDTESSRAVCAELLGADKRDWFDTRPAPQDEANIQP